MVSYPLLVGIWYKKSKLGLRLKRRSCLLPNHSFPQWPLVLLLLSWKKLKLVGGIAFPIDLSHGPDLFCEIESKLYFFLPKLIIPKQPDLA